VPSIERKQNSSVCFLAEFANTLWFMQTIPLVQKNWFVPLAHRLKAWTIVNINRHSYKQVEVSITGYFVGFLVEVGWFVLLVTSFKSRVLGVIFLFYRCLNLTEGVENYFFACASIWQREWNSSKTNTQKKLIRIVTSKNI